MTESEPVPPADSEPVPQDESETLPQDDPEIHLDHAINNCQMLFDPKQTLSREDLCELIDSEIQPKAILFFFITNTCDIVEGLTEQQLRGVIHRIQSFSDEESMSWGKYIFECFITPIDVFKSGQVYAIWSLLFYSAGITQMPADTNKPEETHTEPVFIPESLQTQFASEDHALQLESAE